jgi:hypothetical protein
MKIKAKLKEPKVVKTPDDYFDKLNKLKGVGS